jgi:dipeptidase D
MGRLLYYLSKDFDIALRSVEGGTGANVIAQFCTAEIVVSTHHTDKLISRVEDIRNIFKNEYMGQEDDMSITAEGGEYSSYDAMDKKSTLNVIRFLYASLDGVQTMDRVIEGNVETSLNAGVVVTDKDDNKVRVSIQARSSVDSKLDDMLSKLTIWGEMTGGYVNVKSSYPAWPYNPDSVLRPLMVDVYRKMYGKDPEVIVSHGGLEGGILMGKQPELDIVCFGPDLRGVHTPDERISISSTQRTWEYLKEVLKECK